MKTCTKCKIEKETKEFSKDRRRKDGLRSDCKSCWNQYKRNYRTKPDVRIRERKQVMEYISRPEIKKQRLDYARFRKYGISLKDFNKIFLDQGECCKICKINASPNGTNWCVDHDHRTGKVRGILCKLCNNLLGMCKDNLGTLQNAIKYLRDK